MKQLLSLSILLLVAFSCKKKPPEFNEPMSISVYEDIGNNGNREVMLTFETDRSLTCGSAIIEGGATVSGKDISVEVSGITTPPNCAYAPRKASRSFSAGKLDEGSYNLTIKNGNHLSNGTLTVTKDKVSVALTKSDNISLAGNEISRIPNGVIWGNVMYARPDQAPIADSFTTDLQLRGAAPISLADGEYHYFTIRSGTLTVAYNGVNLYLYRKDFLYTYTGITDSLQRFMSDYFHTHPQTNFFIRSSDGRSFNIPGPPVTTL